MLNNKIMQRLLVFLFVLGGAFLEASAQDLKQDLAQLTKAFEQLSTLHLKAETRTYPVAEDQSIEKQQVEVFLKEGNMFSRMGALFYLRNEACLLSIKEDKQFIYYQPYEASASNEKTSIGEITGLFNEQWEVLKAGCDSIVYHGLTDSGKHYALYKQDNEIQRLEFFFNPQTSFLNKMIYHYDPIGSTTKRVEVEYLVFDEKAVISDQKFDPLTYVDIDASGKIVGKGKYKSFQVYGTN